MAKTRPGSSVLSFAVLQAALDGLEAQRTRLEQQISDLQSMLGGIRRGNRGITGPDIRPATPARPARKKRTMSAAARKRIAAAQKKRWAEFRKAKGKE